MHASSRSAYTRQYERLRALVDFEEATDVLVLQVAKHVEAQAARFIPLGADGVHLARFEESFAAHSGLSQTFTHSAGI